jgi:hypothetical protein
MDNKPSVSVTIERTLGNGKLDASSFYLPPLYYSDNLTETFETIARSMNNVLRTSAGSEEM